MIQAFVNQLSKIRNWIPTVSTAPAALNEKTQAVRARYFSNFPTIYADRGLAHVPHKPHYQMQKEEKLNPSLNQEISRIQNNQDFKDELKGFLLLHKGDRLLSDYPAHALKCYVIAKRFLPFEALKQKAEHARKIIKNEIKA